MWGMEVVGNEKHVSIGENVVKQLVHDGLTVAVYCPTANMRTDIFTTPLARVKFEEHRECLGVLLIDIKNKKGC